MPPSIEEVNAAEKKVTAARADLRDYIQRTVAAVRDRQIRDLLNQELTRTIEEYSDRISELR
jgi:hypothetical protein